MTRQPSRIVLRDSAELGATAAGQRRLHLVPPDMNRARPWRPGTRLVVCSQTPSATDPVRVILTSSRVVQLASLTQRDAQAMLSGTTATTLSHLQWWWCDRHDPRHIQTTAHLAGDQREMSMTRTPAAWEHWAHRYVWRLEWMLDPEERVVLPRRVTRQRPEPGHPIRWRAEDEGEPISSRVAALFSRAAGPGIRNASAAAARSASARRPDPTRQHPARMGLDVERELRRSQAIRARNYRIMGARQ